MIEWMGVLAQSSGGTGTDPLPLVSYGALGIVVLALLFGLLWTKPAVENIIKRAEKAENQRDALLDVVTKEVLPKLAANTESNAALKPVLQEVVRALDYVASQQDSPRRARGRQAPE